MKQPGLLVDSALELPVYLLQFLARLGFELEAEILQQELPFLCDSLQCESYILECERFGEKVRSALCAWPLWCSPRLDSRSS